MTTLLLASVFLSQHELSASLHWTLSWETGPILTVSSIPSLLVSGSDCEATEDEDQRIPTRDARPLPPLLILAPHWLEAVLSPPMRTRAWRGRGGRGPGPGTGLRRSDSRGRYGEIWIPISRPGQRRFCGEKIWVSQRTVAISEYSEKKQLNFYAKIISQFPKLRFY